MNIEEIYKQFYLEHQDENKAIFDKKLIQTSYTIKGVKTCELAEFAKFLYQQKFSFFDLPLNFHEDILIAGMFASIEKNIENKIEYLKVILKHIDNWATCDMIACRMKGLDSQEKFFYYLLSSAQDFEIRFAIVWLKSFKLKTDLNNILDKIIAIKNNNYFVKMAQAWTIAEGFVVDFEKTFEKMKNCDDKFVVNKSIQKACESFRISKERKDFLKNIKYKRIDYVSKSC